jgi:hypothetical protein
MERHYLLGGLGPVEGVIKDEPTGIDLNANYTHYKLPTIADNPTMFVETYNEIEPYGPFVCQGLGRTGDAAEPGRL